MRLNEYYADLIRDGRKGRPTIHEARADFRRAVEQRFYPYRIR